MIFDKIYKKNKMSFSDNGSNEKFVKFSSLKDMILKDHNIFISCNKKITFDENIIMEHSYSRDWRPANADDLNLLNTRSIMVHRPLQCPSCHLHTHDEGIEVEDYYSPPIPTYNEESAKEAMMECEKITNSKTNSNEDFDWELSLNKFGWSTQQTQLFERVNKLLDLDKLSRLAHKERQHEPVLRRVTIDKSVQRMRQALGSVSWDSKLTQWIHGILMDHLPPSYLASYLDILQTMKSKIPSLVDKMIFGRSGGNQDLLKSVFKRPWEPVIDSKNRKLPNQPIILIVPSAPSMGGLSTRTQKLYALFATMASVVPVQCHITGALLNKQGLQFIVDQLMSVTRAKIQEIRNATPNRSIILVGFNAGAALALQIALVETVNCVVCMGFSYNTVHGVRGAPDDHILDLVTPILFVIGQNSTRVSQEEVESLREKMQAQTSLVVVGSADDVLRVGKNKRQIERVTQAMVDNMIMDEIADFVTNCLLNPPGPRQPTVQIPNANSISLSNGSVISNRYSHSTTNTVRKRNLNHLGDASEPPIKVRSINKGGRGRPPLIAKIPAGERLQLTPLTNPSSEALDMAIASILPDTESSKLQTPKHKLNSQPQKIMTSYEIVPASSKPKLEIRQVNPSNQSQMIQGVGGTPIVLPILQRPVQKVKVIPPNQFVQLKPQTGGTQKVYTLKSSPKAAPLVSTSTSQIFTLKSNQPALTTITDGQIRGNKFYTIKSGVGGTQLITTTTNGSGLTGATTSSIVLSPKKFTVIKPSPENNMQTTKPQPDLSNTNIFDIPIVFADNDGNIQESASISNTNATTAQSVVITQSQQMNKEETIRKTIVTPNIINRNIVINNLLANKNKQNKVVLINPNAVKAVPGLITKNIPQIKYTKVVVTSSSKDSNMIAVPITVSGTDTGAKHTTFQTISNSGKLELINSGILKQNTTAKFKPIIINVDSNNSSLKNMIKVGDTQIKPSNTIVIKSGTSLKQFPILKPGLLNRNLTVKKVVNIVPQKTISQQIVSSSPSIVTTNVVTSVPVTSTTTNDSDNN